VCHVEQKEDLVMVDEGTGLCALGVSPQSANLWILGDVFMRSVSLPEHQHEHTPWCSRPIVLPDRCALLYRGLPNRRYYCAFDYGAKRIGFAVAN
jgi:hypothetical protein